MTTLILVRHAQSAPDPALPERDWPLSELGRQQAADLAPVLKELGVDTLASSPFARAVATLKPYADAAGLPIVIVEDLRERALGGWLATTEEVEDAIRNMHADLDFKLEGGETGRACRTRFEAALARLVSANPGRTIAAAAHGGVIGHLLASQAPLEGDFWRRIRNPHLFVFDAGGPLKWMSERAFDGTPGVRGA
jgi:2,3-bisphosphoglycerate-dependent phosphoglycerate mutase